VPADLGEGLAVVKAALLAVADVVARLVDEHEQPAGGEEPRAA
jgi:hypothetical protein